MTSTQRILSRLRQSPERAFIALHAKDITAPAQDPARPSAYAEAVAQAQAEGMAFGPLIGVTVRKLSRAKALPCPKSKREVDRILAPYGVEVQHGRGSGYFYLTDVVTGAQVGESIYVCHYHQMDVGQWAERGAAVMAAKQMSRGATA